MAWALEEFEYVETIGFSYNQRHIVELECRDTILKKVKEIKNNWNLALGSDYLIDLPVIPKIADSALTSDTQILFKKNGLPNTFVPGRNLFFFITAASLAYRKNISTLIGGMCETDFSGYPDCRNETILALEKTINFAYARKFKIETPLMWSNKSVIWETAEKIAGRKLVDLIINDTHTCYLGDRKNLQEWGYGCGECPACKLRKEGFKTFQLKR